DASGDGVVSAADRHGRPRRGGREPEASASALDRQLVATLVTHRFLPMGHVAPGRMTWQVKLAYRSSLQPTIRSGSFDGGTRPCTISITRAPALPPRSAIRHVSRGTCVR